MKKDYTVKEIAELLDVSKPTVQKVINDKKIEACRIEKNKFRYYNIEQTKEIILEIQEDFDIEKISPNTAKNTAKFATNGDNSDNFAEVSEKSFEKSQNATLKLIEMLQNEIDKKDKELEKKNKRIEKLEATIEEHTKTIADLAKQASYITAADKTAQIIDKSQEQAEAAAAADDKPVKKKWFNFFSK